MSGKLAYTRVIGRSGQRTRQVAVLAVRGAAFGEVDPPVGARRNRLELQFARGCHHHRECAFGQCIGGAVVLGAQRGSRSPRSTSMSATPAASQRAMMPAPCGVSAAERVTSTRAGVHKVGYFRAGAVVGIAFCNTRRVPAIPFGMLRRFEVEDGQDVWLQPPAAMTLR